jgi:hypothetical protein
MKRREFIALLRSEARGWGFFTAAVSINNKLPRPAAGLSRL